MRAGLKTDPTGAGALTVAGVDTCDDIDDCTEVGTEEGADAAENGVTRSSKLSISRGAD